MTVYFAGLAIAWALCAWRAEANRDAPWRDVFLVWLWLGRTAMVGCIIVGVFIWGRV